MDKTHASSTDPVALVRSLDAELIRERLDSLDRERQALIVLLRAAQRAAKDEPIVRNAKGAKR